MAAGFRATESVPGRDRRISTIVPPCRTATSISTGHVTRMERGSDMPNASKPAIQTASTETMAAEISRLAGLPIAELRAAWRAEFRQEPPKSLWRELLLRTLAWRLQEKAFGGHDKTTAKLLDEYGRGKEANQLHRQLKSGTVLVREFEGVRHTVTIVPDGYVWQEKTYASLTAIARVITGTNWNGPRFLGLRVGAGRKDQSSKVAA